MPDTVRRATVEFSPTMVRVVGSLIHAIIPRDRIRKIRVVHETIARYPFAQFFLGFVLVLLGGVGVLVLVLTGVGEALPIRVVDGELEVKLVPVTSWLAITLGAWWLVGVLRAGYHLTIETDERVRTMFLGSSRDVKDIRRFVRQASWGFGYEIDASVLGEVDAPADRGGGAR